MSDDLKIDYVEFVSPAMDETQDFFARAFGWSFVEYGPDYRDIQDAGLGAGIERGDLRAPLVVLRTDDLPAAMARVVDAGAVITVEPFDFPGGRRFQFRVPGGTEMAVWTQAAE